MHVESLLSKSNRLSGFVALMDWPELFLLLSSEKVSLSCISSTKYWIFLFKSH